MRHLGEGHVDQSRIGYVGKSRMGYVGEEALMGLRLYCLR